MVLGDLAALGYDARWGVLGADDAGAPHQRKRIWLLAYTNQERRLRGARPREEQAGGRQPANTDWWSIEPRLG